MRINLQNRVFLTFVLIVALFAAIGCAVGALLISRTLVDEAQLRVNLDLRSAWNVLDSRQEEMLQSLAVLAGGDRVAAVYAAPENESLRSKFESILRAGGLDFIGVTDRAGRVILRGSEPYKTGDSLANDPLIRSALRGEAVKGFQVLPEKRLRLEGGNLAERAFIVFEPTPKAKAYPKESESAGMVLAAAAPVRDTMGNVIGAIYAGALMVRNNALVDRIRSIVFKDETYKDRPLGTVTVFQWDVRVATNVVKANGNRALGTRVSSEVYDRVLENDKSWYNRAFVVNDWYLSAYDPIRDVEGKVIGILYVGVLARRYDDVKNRLYAFYGGLSVGAALLVIGVGYLFSRRLTRSCRRLANAAVNIGDGNLNLAVPEPAADDEIRDLTRSFNAMAANLREDRAEIEAANASLQALNANYLDMLGFVSHELKNTLGVIYTGAHSLDAGLVGSLTAPQARLVASITRSINTAVSMTRHYLDLARIEQGELRVDGHEMDFAKDVAEPTLAALAAAAHARGISIETELPETIPMKGEPDLLRVAYGNLLDNAFKYGREGGRVRLAFGEQEGLFRFEVWNEGEGLPPDKLPRLFEKFVRLGVGADGVRKGTGLGLFITHEIIVKHGGTIRAESEHGSWINFIVELPASGSQGGPRTLAKPAPEKK
jgi:two-component system NtrC family sensor kinase